jgi:signal peptidase II
MSMSKKIIFPALVFLIFFLDRITKALAVKYIYLSTYKILPFLSLTYVENSGVAFGMFKDRNIFFLISNSAFLIVLLLIRKKFSDKYSKYAIHLIIAGALGNIYDRISYGYVVDFIDLKFFPAVFNIADFSITVGGCLLAYSLWFVKKVNKVA